MGAEIWKFRLAPIGEAVEHQAPDLGRALHFGIQDAQFYAWCLVQPSKKLAPAAFKIIGTGWPVPEGWDYAGTVQEGPYVWHLFQTTQGAGAREG